MRKSIEEKWKSSLLKRVWYEVNVRNGHDKALEYVETIYYNETIGTRTIVWRDKETHEIVEISYKGWDDTPISIKVTREG